MAMGGNEMHSELEVRPLTDLFDRVLRIDVPVVAFELDQADLERWTRDRTGEADPMAYRGIPVRSLDKGESRFRFMGKSGVFGYLEFSKSLSGLTDR